MSRSPASPFDQLSRSLLSVQSSLREVIDVLTTDATADCVLWSVCGAGVLRKLGFDAKAVAGFAAWRVGSGDGDVVLHAPIAGVKQLYSAQGRSAPFHAWVEVSIPDEVVMVDLTTHSLPAKAKALDAHDGQSTRVDWHPPFVCFSAKARSTEYGTAANIRAVTMAANPGQYGCYHYQRLASVEDVVLAGMEDKLGHITEAAFAVHGASLHGSGLRVVAL